MREAWSGFRRALPILGIKLSLLGSITGEATAPPATPAERFDALERRMLEAREVHISFTIKAEGVITADLKGNLELRSGDLAVLEATGEFGGGEVKLALRADGETVKGGNETLGQLFDRPVPAALREAIVIGVTRMGTLHNVARLFAGVGPDHAAGGVREWVKAVDVIDGGDATEEVIDGTKVRAIQFGIEVNDRRSVNAGLWLDPEGLPRRRKQTVSFGSKEMHVEEIYHVFSVGDTDSGEKRDERGGEESEEDGGEEPGVDPPR